MSAPAPKSFFLRLHGLMSCYLHLLWERGCVIVSDVDRYVIIRKAIRVCFQRASGIHTPVRNSSTLTST
jgi:hypothetical protein